MVVDCAKDDGDCVVAVGGVVLGAVGCCAGVACCCDCCCCCCGRALIVGASAGDAVDIIESDGDVEVAVRGGRLDNVGCGAECCGCGCVVLVDDDWLVVGWVGCGAVGSL